MKPNCIVGTDVRRLRLHPSSSPGRLLTSSPTKTCFAFTLLEVMIAVSLFFIATFAILGLMSRTLSQARSLQPLQIDANVVAAELSLTNVLKDGPIPPEIITRFEHMYPGYTCAGTITEIYTNGFFQIDIDVGGLTAGKHIVHTRNSVYLFRRSGNGGLGGGGAGMPGNPPPIGR